MLDIINLQEEFNDYYGQGIEYLVNSNQVEAKRCLTLAVNKMLDLAKCCTGVLQSQKIKHAEELLLLINKINLSMKHSKNPVYNNGANSESEGKSNFMPVEKTNICLNDVAGLDNVKEEVRKAIIFPMKYPDIYKKFKKSKGGGILLYGVPGTGKTMIAQAIANEIDAKFYTVKCSDIASKWFGDSERNIKELFAEARKNRYSIIFFDEFEALGAKRTEHNNALKTVVPEFLNQMQGFDKSDNTLLCIAATNRPWDIDSAFLRPGRFNTQIYVDLPNDESRRTIVAKQLEDIPVCKNFNIDKIVEATKGFNGADVVHFCDSLKDLAIDRSINLGFESAINNDDIDVTASNVTSSVRTKDLERINRYSADYNNIY